MRPQSIILRIPELFTNCPRTRVFNIAQFQNGKSQQVLPSILAEHENDIASFQKYCNDMVLKLLTLFSIGLEVRILYSPPNLCYCISRLSLRSPFPTPNFPQSPRTHNRKLPTFSFTDSPLVWRSLIPPLATHKRPHKIHPPPPLLPSHTSISSL